MLTNLATKHNTDKVRHGFIPVYEAVFEPIRLLPLNILEIGVWNGGSLRMMEEYFPNATILGVDIVDKSVYNSNRVTTKICDQSNPEQLLDACAGMKFDIIIDDGSHVMTHQQISMKVLFPLLKDGGIYIMEDLHTSLRRKNYIQQGHGYGDTFDYTTLTMLKQMKRGMVFTSDVMSVKEYTSIAEAVETVDVYCFNELDSITGVVRKKSVA